VVGSNTAWWWANRQSESRLSHIGHLVIKQKYMSRKIFS
jgi:hypothetical protein